MKLYWIHLPEHQDPFTEGYIGITSRDLDARLSEHLTRHEEITEACVIDLIAEGSDDEMSMMELHYRPESWIGWNRAKGGLTGGRPHGIHTSGWTWSDEAKAQRSIDVSGSKNGMYGKPQSGKQKAAVSKAMKGKKKTYKVKCNWPTLNGADNPRARSVEIDGVVYDTLNEAAAATGIHRTTIAHRCKSPNPKYSGYKAK